MKHTALYALLLPLAFLQSSQAALQMKPFGDSVYKRNQVDARILRNAAKWKQEMAFAKRKEEREQIIPCVSDVGCRGADLPFCSAGRCAECVTNLECGGDLPICSLGRCSSCYHNDQCKGADAKCLVDGSCASAETQDLPYHYAGCFRDNYHPYRQLGQQITDLDYIRDQKMTASRCIEFCGSSGYPLAGLEGGNGCFCGWDFKRGHAQHSSSCNFPCKGDGTHICGGFDNLSLYYAPSYNITDLVPLEPTPTESLQGLAIQDRSQIDIRGHSDVL